MSGAEVLDFARDSIFTLLIMATPVMVIGLIVGVVIALVQALTQIQEMTLVFVPKIIVIFLAVLLTLPFMSSTIGSYMARVAERITNIG